MTFPHDRHPRTPDPSLTGSHRLVPPGVTPTPRRPGYPATAIPSAAPPTPPVPTTPADPAASTDPVPPSEPATQIAPPDVTAVLDLVQQVRAYATTAEDALLEPLSARLTEPLRVALVGRVSSGKSTLLNAMIGRRVAGTAAQDCTMLVTSYRDGSPDRVELVYRDGRRERTRIPPLELHLAALDPAEVERVEVVLQAGPLQQMTLIDTPGLGATEDRPSLLGSDPASTPDIYLYLFRGTIRTDDADVVRAYRDATGDAVPQATRSVGILSHADNFGEGGWGSPDPVEQAAAAADRIMQALPGHFSTVIPVSGLLAQTARTGVLTEDDVRVLRRLVDLDPALLRAVGQIPLPDVPAEVMARLSAALGSYGINHGRAFASSSVQLHSWALSRSGVQGLERHLQQRLVPMVQHGRVAALVDDLARLVHGRITDPRAGAAVERAQYGPQLHPVREYRAYRLLLDHAPSHPLSGTLADLLATPLPADRAGLIGAHGPDAGRRCLELAAEYQATAAMSPHGVEAEAARTLSQSLLYLADSLAGGAR